MLEFLPTDIREGLDTAQRRAAKRRSRLRVQVGEAVYPILRLMEEGMVIDAGMAPHLRGLVDIYDGSRHLCTALIVASTVENGELVCDFKRSTNVTDRPALDFWKDENAPVAFLTKS
jgi:hypothetical protein